MTRLTRITMATLAALAIVAPVATAMPSRDAVGSSNLAGTTSAPQQDQPSCGPSSACMDRRSPDARDASMRHHAASILAPGKDYRSPDARDAGTNAIRPVPALPARPSNPEPIAPAPVNAATRADGHHTSPLVYLLPGAIVSVLLAAGIGYAVHTSGRPPARAHRRLTAPQVRRAHRPAPKS